ncbi:MAG TPA: hypothetical protein VF600_07185 [Abditibacteriaceae bacterium]|jgi:hypothetical protein
MRITDRHGDAFFLNKVLNTDQHAAELKRLHTLRGTFSFLYAVASVGMCVMLVLFTLHTHQPEYADLLVTAMFLYAKMSYNDLDSKIKFMKVIEAQQLAQQNAVSSS